MYNATLNLEMYIFSDLKARGLHHVLFYFKCSPEIKFPILSLCALGT